MNGLEFFTLGIGLILGFFIGKRKLGDSRLKKIMDKPFPFEWEKILRNNVALYKYIPHDLKTQLHKDINIFMGEKNFEGCGGLEITDEIKISIAAQACILLLNKKATFFPKLVTILVYPSAYIGKKVTLMGNIPVEEDSARLGESWNEGTVVLAWDHVKLETHDINDAHNVVLHEFAHQLDQEDGAADGAPIMEHRANYAPWAKVLCREYGELIENVKHYKKDIIDPYGTTNPAEFFAVITEVFFKKPKQLKNKHPELYNELSLYYKMDPVDWFKCGDNY